MATERKERIVRVDDFIAEQMEREASLLPPSEAVKARIFLDHATLLRDSKSMKFIRAAEES